MGEPQSCTTLYLDVLLRVVQMQCNILALAFTSNLETENRIHSPAKLIFFVCDTNTPYWDTIKHGTKSLIYAQRGLHNCYVESCGAVYTSICIIHDIDGKVGYGSIFAKTRNLFFFVESKRGLLNITRFDRDSAADGIISITELRNIFQIC